MNALRNGLLRNGLLVLLGGILSSAAVMADETGPIIGRKIEGFTLHDYRGQGHSLEDLKDSELVVLYFLGTECPLAKLYAPRMQALSEEFGLRRVTIWGVNSNTQDSITEIAAHARTHGVTFPILKDLGNKLADQCGATRTPEVVLLDAERRIQYHGRVDSQYTFGAGVGLAQPQLDRRDLATAIEELLDGQPVSVPVTEAKGCLIGRVRKADENSTVTYSNQIARLLQQRCLECHRAGQIAPFAMTEYDEVAGWGEMIAEVVREQRMPPWHAHPAHGEFVNENRLTEVEKQQVYTWVENGCPEGDPSELPEPREFHDQWFLPREPDRVIYMADEPVDVKAEGVEDYRYYTVDPGFEEDKWVRLAECRPGNRAVVHHIIVYVKPPGQQGVHNGNGEGDIRGFTFLAGFAPGTRPLVAPAGMAKRIPAGSRLVFELHYTPIGSPRKDRSGIGLIFVDESEVTHQMATSSAMNFRFKIPPHDDNHLVESRKTFARDSLLLSLFPHMHMRGKSFKYEVTYPDGSHEILLEVPRYDFNWQNSYILAEPKLIPQGTKLLCTAYFDNSEDNLANPDPSKTVRWGNQTWDEMMIGWYDVAFPKDEAQLIADDEQADAEDETD